MEDSESANIRRDKEAVATWGIGIYEHDHVTDKIYGSPRTRELYGLSTNEELSIEVFGAATFPADIPLLMKAIEQAHDPDGDGTFDLLHRIRRRDGTIRWIHTRATTTFHTQHGERVPFLTSGSIMDITDRQQLKLALERQEERLTHATETASVGIFEYNHDPEDPRDALYWSPTLRKLLGFDETQPASLQWLKDRICPQAPDASELTVEEILSRRDTKPFDLERRFLHPDGTYRWFLLRAATSFHRDKEKMLPLRTVGGVLDITASKSAAEGLAQRSAILEATPDFVSITRPNGDMLYLNQAGRRFMGVGESESLHSRSMAQAHPNATNDYVVEFGLPVANKEGIWRGETEFVNGHGETTPMSEVIIAHYDSRGEVSHYSNIARDLSREKLLEEQFRQAQKMEAIGNLAGGVAHDFNNLLSVILGFAELGANKIQKDDQVYQFLTEIEKAAKRASALTRQLLAFSRKQILQPQVVDINRIIRTTSPMFERLINERIEFSVKLSEGELPLKADPNQIEQMLLNLVVNAKDAMPGGGNITIKTQRTIVLGGISPTSIDLPPGAYVVIYVSDTGHGMDSNTRERIFDPFFTTKGQGKGTGLGLSTVFGIVNQSGGKICVESEPRVGTNFEIYFPYCDEPIAENVIAPISSTHFQQGTVLVSEDEPQLRKMITTALKGVGYTVLDAEGPLKALAISENHQEKIDLLLTDVMMPQMTGKELASEISKSRPETPVLYMSGYTEDCIVRQSVLEENIDFLAKPFTARALLSKVRRIIQKKRESSASS